MKKLNKKGFVLVETLIVTVFVVALFIVIYQATVPALGELEQQNKYDDIDTVYYSNIYKKLINRYANTKLIDEYLSNSNNNNYMDITDCNLKVNGGYVYNNREYCEFIKQNIGFGQNDRVLLTEYDITGFRNKVKTMEYFDTGILSNFRDYLQTVPTVERFYSKKDDNSSIDGKYRLFFIREVKETDGSLTMRFANIGIYSGGYDNYFQGDTVTFDPGDGRIYFYVLHDSLSTESTVTLIAAHNVNFDVDDRHTPYFNCTGKFVVPDQEHSPLLPAFRTDIEIDDTCSTVEVPNIINELALETNPKEYAHDVDNTNTLLAELKAATENWTNTNPIKPDKYIANAGYTIDYTNFHARLLNTNDIRRLLRCDDNNDKCFEADNAYTVPLDSDLDWLYNGTVDEDGYWTAESVVGSNMYAWTIKSGRIEPVVISNHTNIGVRPVIEVSKDNPLLERIFNTGR